MNSNKKNYVVIFDCDGVMFNSLQANINYYNHLLTHFNLPEMTGDKISYVHMHTGDESTIHLFKGTPYLDDAQEYRKTMDYLPFIKDMIIEPGLKELLTELRPKFGLSIATSRSNTIGNVLETNGLENYFDIVVSSLDVINPKPHPESVFKILDFFKTSPDNTFYIGDSLVDYETASASSVTFIAYGNKALKTPYHADSMLEVSKILESII